MSMKNSNEIFKGYFRLIYIIKANWRTIHNDRFLPHNSNSVGSSPSELVAPLYLKKFAFTPINV